MKTMHTLNSSTVVAQEAAQQFAETSNSVWQDAMLLGKPRITLMVMMTVAIGFLFAPLGTSQWMLMLHAYRHHTREAPGLPEVRGGLAPAVIRRVQEYLLAHLA